jgi:hypothetical protein
MLGAILWAATAEDIAPWTIACLATGWLLMPSLLAASLRSPAFRLLLAVPAGAVLSGVLGVCWSAADDPTRLAGWAMVTAGIALGGSLGLWFWYRLLPVPHRLRQPLAPGRWWLIGVHVSLVVAGLVCLLIKPAG